NPGATRPWQHVLEPLSGYIVLAEKNFQDSQAFRGGWNFGPGPEQELTVEQVVRATCEKWGSQASFESQAGDHPHEAHLLKLDCRKALEKLQWKATLNFEQTIQWTVDWYKTHAFESDRLSTLMNRQLEDYTHLYREKR
ncbi:MAG: CDP-glucose 4,6-dehydratase, partial [Pseudobdellovibrionaceae bacterium]